MAFMDMTVKTYALETANLASTKHTVLSAKRGFMGICARYSVLYTVRHV